MADNDTSDPQIVARLKNVPPFYDPPEETKEEPPVEEKPEEPVESTVEAEGENKTEVKEEPDEQKKRTQEQFDKLKEHNAELKKALEEAKAKAPTKNALESLYPEEQSPVTNVVPTSQQFPTLTNKEIKDTFANLTDDQGYVDTGLLKETLVNLQKSKEEAMKRAEEAENRAQRVEKRQDDFERKQIMKEVHALYPKLDPNNADSEDPEKRFDQRFYDQFRKETMFQWSTTGQADPLKVAEAAYDTIYGEAMKKADREKAEAAELAKKNINATKVKPTSTVSSYKDRDELIKATRSGLKGALAERLKRAGQ